MTQVKDKTDQQLNRALAELMGWTDFKEDAHGGTWATAPDYRWTNKRPDYCSDPAASLEVQAKAIEVDASNFINRLAWIVRDRISGDMEWTNNDIVVLLNASPRERAEAAYITLQGAQK
ncbi:hypothetical protein [Paenibacillus sp. FSL R5-0908]|uniref:hypothetical protein n=1 Tax=Paenibacillus sp. FSL R5-0908 TaxID=2921664 RepID=UPI0030F98F1D